MITESRLQVIPSAQSDGYRFVSSPDIASVSVTVVTNRSVTRWRDAMNVAVASLDPIFNEWLSKTATPSLLLFIASSPSVAPNALMRRRGIWGSPEARGLPGEAARSGSVELEEAGAVRFAGLMAISAESRHAAAECARSHGSTLLFLPSRPDLSEFAVRSLAKLTLSTTGSGLDWERVTAMLGTAAVACVRVHGNFDDPELAIDVFIKRSDLERLSPSLVAPRIGDG